MNRVARLLAAALWVASSPSRPAPRHGEDLPGLEFVADRISDERHVLLGTYDALSVKAGVIATAAVTLPALTATGSRPLVIAGAALAGVALLLAVYVVWPRRLGGFGASQLVDEYLDSDPAEALAEFVATERVVVDRIADIGDRLAIAAMVALGFLVASAILLIVAVIVGS